MAPSASAVSVGPQSPPSCQVPRARRETTSPLRPNLTCCTVFFLGWATLFTGTAVHNGTHPVLSSRYLLQRRTTGLFRPGLGTLRRGRVADGRPEQGVLPADRGR